jgi:hypothetical protein
MGNRVSRSRCWFDRVLKHITAVFDSQHSGIVGARIVATGIDVAVYVTIPDTVVRLKARQRRPSSCDRTTSVIHLLDALAVDDLAS